MFWILALIAVVSLVSFRVHMARKPQSTYFLRRRRRQRLDAAAEHDAVDDGRD